ncbi:MAG TPA: MerR family transcriptional regulator [Candidatus Dormibacteraeota bacterium]|nr:MerR family transcriptional regulator [Candidatus Dormibacteraeota bacterium]
MSSEMNLNEEPLYRAKAFAALAGVTVRALHLYDRIGLLPPAQRTAAGYRLYGAAELERLEHIVALRFVGFGLDRIQELLAGRTLPLLEALQLQRRMMAQQQRHLGIAITAIDRAQRAFESGAAADRWETLRTVIEVLKMQQDWSWTERYYTDEDRAKLAKMCESTPREIVESGERDWAALIADVEEAARSGESPSSQRGRDLAGRWKTLVGAFTQGDPGIARGLNRMWTDTEHHPEGFKRPWSDEADRFIKAAMG